MFMLTHNRTSKGP